MRFVFVGASDLAVRTAQLMVDRGHAVVIIEQQRQRIDELSDDMDCSFIHGDGSKPHVLQEAGAGETDVLFCLTNHDETNIIAALVGRSQGFERVVPAINDPELESICRELDLQDTIIPSRTIARYLADMATGLDVLELSTILKGEARFFSFTLGAADAGTVEGLGLPEGARVICYYRDGEFTLANGDSRLQKADEIVLITHSRNLPALRKRWQPRESEDSA